MAIIFRYLDRFKTIIAALGVSIPATYGVLNLFAYKSDLNYIECRLHNEAGKEQSIYYGYNEQLMIYRTNSLS
jgi:hypothetical protein